MPDRTHSSLTTTKISQEQQIDQYLKSRLALPGHFTRTGWQTWLCILMQHPEEFPVSLKQFLDTCVSPVLFPTTTSSLDGMMYSYYKVCGERLFPNSQLVAVAVAVD